ncbi:hypothetical protein [Prevotella pallens]|jgi:hypothetical protein|uniref:hypothetical protein n=1 Tax=Prevotella pallens TaxID=60133 RepID=UPI001CB0C058|nr:hypothetical protein [Prevotella pallens]MBF1459033.1 hypothetical protein [Prevotella pallens]MBF1502506.1 hypothetical protein [Prevotella pallens]MBF1517932.1 hypothetical protein [Prevotella pallens]
MKKYLKPRIEVTTVSTECQLLAGSVFSISNQNLEVQPHQTLGGEAKEFAPRDFKDAEIMEL